MIIQIEISDNAIKQENDIDNNNISNTIIFYIRYIFEAFYCFGISNNDVKISIK